MGSGKRKRNTEYVAPSVGGGMAVECPALLPLRVKTVVAIAPGSRYPVRLASDGGVLVGNGSTVHIVERVEPLKRALSAGCLYRIDFVEPLAAGQSLLVNAVLA